MSFYVKFVDGREHILENSQSETALCGVNVTRANKLKIANFVRDLDLIDAEGVVSGACSSCTKAKKTRLNPLGEVTQ